MVRIALLILAGATLLMGGCASSDAPTRNTPNNLTDTGHVNTIPWNRPERWEGAGALGGMLNSR